VTTTDENPHTLLPVGALEFTGDGDLKIDPKLVESRVRRKALSPSTMNALVGKGSCAARFALDPEARTPEQATSLAMKLAAGIDLTQGGKIDLTDQEAMIKRSMLVTDVVNGFRGIFDIEKPHDVDVFSRELKIDNVEVAGVPILGYIDRVDNDADGKLRIVDYKSGKVTKSSDFFGDPQGDQMRVYALAASQIYDTEIKEARLYFTREGKVRRIATSQKYMTDTRRKVVEGWDRLGEYTEQATFPTVVSGLCGWCPLVNACPSAQREGRESKIEAPQAVELGMSIPLRKGIEPEADPATEAPAHAGDENSESTQSTEGAAMTKTKTTWPEDRPWVAHVEGRLNPLSYDASAVVGLTSTAVKHLTAADQVVRPSSVRALTGVFADIIARATRALSAVEEPDWSSGLNSRIRRAMFTIIDEVHPVPFTVADGDETRPATRQEWEAWIERIAGNVTAIVLIAEELWDGRIDPDGHRLFASDGDEEEGVEVEPPTSEDASESEEDEAEEEEDTPATDDEAPQAFEDFDYGEFDDYGDF
jgi:putative RecB family exonuclease